MILSFPVMYVQGMIQIEPCGAAYWIISSFQIPLAVIFTSWILCKKERVKSQGSDHEVLEKKSVNTSFQDLLGLKCLYFD